MSKNAKNCIIKSANKFFVKSRAIKAYFKRRKCCMKKMMHSQNVALNFA